MSVGSKRKNKAKPFCVQVDKPDTGWKQQLKIYPCVDGEERQMWDYVEGRIHSRISPDLCIGYEHGTQDENGGTVLRVQKCFTNNWGYFPVGR